MAENSKLPGLPQQFPHMFFDVAFDLVPEITYKDLVRLSQLAKRLGHVNLYGPLVDCLRKMQWAKLAGLEAIIVEKLKGGFPSMNTPLTKEHYWTTQEFVQFHFDRLTRLFVAVVERCIAVESEGVSEQIEQGTTDTPISAFAMRGTKETTLKQIKFKHWTPVFLNANELMEELPQRLLRILSEKEQDLFAKLARYKTFGMHDRERNFIVMSDDFLEHSLQVQPREIEALKEVGLIADSKLVLPNGAVFVYGQRGFNIYWSDEESRSIPAVVFTRLGRELAALVKTEYDDNYVSQVISMMHASKVNVRLMAISDFQETSFRYDNLGTFEY